MEPLQKRMAFRPWRKVAGVLATIALIAFGISRLDLQPNLARVQVAILSGSEGGNYHAIVSRLAEEAHREGGQIENVVTPGSVDNLAQLAAARTSCRVHFAVVQDGLAWPPGLELVARLPRSESVFFLGRDADRIRELHELRGFRIGIGPEGSGLLARRLLESRDVSGLELTLVNLPLDEQLSLLERGGLDLGVIVMDEDAPMIEHAVRDRKLAIMSLPRADVIARRLDRVRTGRIGAGQYDAVRVLPPTDKTVLRVDALVVGNGCAKRTATTGLLTLLTRALPEVVARNRDTPAAPNVAVASASRRFFEGGGPDFATEHIPWAVDIMPLSNWIYVITAVSLIFNGLGLWSRFRLWRIDARRVKVEERLSPLFGGQASAGDIARLTPGPEHVSPAHRAQVGEVIAKLEALNTLCRKQSLSIVSDMGQEMPYRYQEHLMTEYLGALRTFCARVETLASSTPMQIPS